MGKLKESIEEGMVQYEYIHEPLPEDLKWAVGHAAAFSDSPEETKENALMLLNVLDQLRNDFRNIHKG